MRRTGGKITHISDLLNSFSSAKSPPEEKRSSSPAALFIYFFKCLAGDEAIEIRAGVVVVVGGAFKDRYGSPARSSSKNRQGFMASAARALCI